MHFAFGRHPRGFCCDGSTPSFSPIVLSNFIVFSSENRKFPGAKKPTIANLTRGAVLKTNNSPKQKKSITKKQASK